MTQEQRDIRCKLKRLDFVRGHGNVARTARRFGVSRQTYYKWKPAYGQRA